MIDRPNRLRKVRGAFSADREKKRRNVVFPLRLKAGEALAQSLGHGLRHAFAGEPCEILGKAVRLLGFDVERHRFYLSTH